MLDALELTELVTTIDGLSAVGAAAILAETGDPARFDCARTWVKHAGLCPRANESGTFAGHDQGLPAAAARRCAPPPGEPCGARCPTTRSTPPASPT